MKQIRFGRKVQNWHRPLQANQLKQSFFRHRYDDVEEILRELDSDDFHEFGSYDNWDPWHWGDEDPAFTIHCQNVKQILADRIAVSPLFIPLPESSASQIDSAVSLDKTGSVPWDIESKLFEFIDMLKHDTDLESFDRLTRPNVGSVQSMIAIVRQRGWSEALAKNLCLFAAFWIREPRTFRGQSAADLVNHLLARYETPFGFNQVWLNELDLERLKWHSWYLLFAQGGSLAQAAKTFGWSIANRLQGQMLKLPPRESWHPIHVCIYAQIICLGGSKIEFDRVIANPAFAIDPTDTTDARMLQFWLRTVQWLIRSSDEIGDEQAGLVLDWAMHRFTESRGSAPFSWKGRGVQATVERSIAYLRQRERVTGPSRWKGRDWDWSTDDEINEWTLTELTTSRALYQEGLAMSHCVGGYSRQCGIGSCAIFSLRCNNKRVLTVQIDPQSLQIMQAKGHQNRACHTNEKDFLRQWVQHIATTQDA